MGVSWFVYVFFNNKPLLLLSSLLQIFFVELPCAISTKNFEKAVSQATVTWFNVSVTSSGWKKIFFSTLYTLIKVDNEII